MGVVYHANYLVWCEVGRTDYIRSLGMPYSEMEAMGISLAVAEATLRFHAPARYDELVRVTTELTSVRSRALSFEYLITNPLTAQRLVSASTLLVSLDDSGRPIPIPADVRVMLTASMSR